MAFDVAASDRTGSGRGKSRSSSQKARVEKGMNGGLIEGGSDVQSQDDRLDVEDEWIDDAGVTQARVLN